MFCQVSHKVNELSQVGQVRREASKLASLLDFDENLAGKVSIIATELATNLSRYTTGGEVLLRTITREGSSGVEILALDRGPGISNIAKCMEDGYSSGGTAGNGLGAVRRLASEFDIYSNSPGGSVILARVNRPNEAKPRFQWGVVNCPAPNEQVSGDTWRIAFDQNRLSIMVADGLGHGPQAFEAANTAAKVFDESPYCDHTAFYTRADRQMRGTRGAAIAVAQYRPLESLVQFTGVGNISASIRSRGNVKSRGLVSHNGTVGVEMRKVQQFDSLAPDNSTIILHSDGLQSRWSLDEYPELSDRHAAVIAAILYRDFCRGRDDVTVCVVRYSSTGVF